MRPGEEGKLDGGMRISVKKTFHVNEQTDVDLLQAGASPVQPVLAKVHFHPLAYTKPL